MVLSASVVVTALDHKTAAGVSNRAVIGLGTGVALLAAVGTPSALIETASLAFLFTFAVVCGLALRKRVGTMFITGVGAPAGATASVAFVVRLVRSDRLALVFLGVLAQIAVFGHPVVLRHVRTERQPR